jgi:membrane associated rhomboid family serine protease
MARSRITSHSIARQANQGIAEARRRVVTVTSLVGLVWLVALINTVLGGSLNALGIWPRTIQGLLGIFTAPFLHIGWAHLAANTISFAVLGGLVMMLQGRRLFWRVTVYGALASGLLVWALESSASVTVGASGVIYGYLGFLLAWGYYRRSVAAVVGSVATAFFFGSLTWGVIPGLVGAQVSWLGHLGGLLGGIWAARSVAPRGR